MFPLGDKSLVYFLQPNAADEKRPLCLEGERISTFWKRKGFCVGEGRAGSFENLIFFPNRDGCLRMQAISDQR